MKTKAAVAFEASKPLEIVELDLEGPKEGEVLVEIKASGICHTDAYTLSGADPEGIFPSVLGHEGAGVVVDVGKMLPLYLLVITSYPCIPLNVENVNIALILKQIFVRQYGLPKVRD